MLPVFPLLPLPFRLPLPLGNTFYYFVLSAVAAAVFDSISGFFLRFQGPRAGSGFILLLLLLMMIMMDNCEGLIMMTLCVMRKLARTELDPASSQLNSTRLNSLLIMQNPNRAGAEQRHRENPLLPAVFAKL